VKPGIRAVDTSATAHEVKMTRPMASKLIGLRKCQKSFQDIFQAAKKSSGGRKIRNTRSGSSVMSSTFGMKPMINPQSTRNIGYGIFSFSLTIVSSETDMSRTMISRR
jgi:hypothetical protein